MLDVPFLMADSFTVNVNICLGLAVLDWAMAHATLPCLKVFRACMMGQLDSDTLASFLNRHPHITTLTVEVGRPFSVNSVLILPELEDVTGPLQLITLLSC